MPTTHSHLTPSQARTLRLIVETHGGCRVNLHVARALERRGYVTVSERSPKVPQPTAAGIAHVEAQS